MYVVLPLKRHVQRRRTDRVARIEFGDPDGVGYPERLLAFDGDCGVDDVVFLFEFREIDSVAIWVHIGRRWTWRRSFLSRSMATYSQW